MNIKGVNLAFYQLRGPVAAFVAIIVGFIIFKGSVQEKFETFLEGCGHQDIIAYVYHIFMQVHLVVSKTMGELMQL